MMGGCISTHHLYKVRLNQLIENIAVKICNILHWLLEISKQKLFTSNRNLVFPEG